MKCPAGKCECVYFSPRLAPEGSDFCHSEEDNHQSINHWKRCPVEPKAPKKDPISELTGKICSFFATSSPDDLSVVHRIVESGWPKDKPKGDIDKTWEFLYKNCDQLQGRVTIGREELEKAFEAAGLRFNK